MIVTTTFVISRIGFHQDVSATQAGARPSDSTDANELRPQVQKRILDIPLAFYYYTTRSLVHSVPIVLNNQSICLE